MASWFESVHVGWRHVIKPRLLQGHPRGDHLGAKCNDVSFRNRYMLVIMWMDGGVCEWQVTGVGIFKIICV